MMGTQLHWVEGPWPGQLAMAARPRGGDWLEDEIAAWQRCGVDTVVSLLEGAEEAELDLAGERAAVLVRGMSFRSLPTVDRGVPDHEGDWLKAVSILNEELGRGKNVVVHCRQGVGRTGLLAGCLLMAQGYGSAEAVAKLTDARGVAVPETAGQRIWLDQHAESFVAAR